MTIRVTVRGTSIRIRSRISTGIPVVVRVADTIGGTRVDADG